MPWIGWGVYVPPPGFAGAAGLRAAGFDFALDAFATGRDGFFVAALTAFFAALFFFMGRTLYQRDEGRPRPRSDPRATASGRRAAAVDDRARRGSRTPPHAPRPPRRSNRRGGTRWAPAPTAAATPSRPSRPDSPRGRRRRIPPGRSAR